MRRDPRGTLLSPTETFKTKLPTDNISHGDQHAEMSRSSGALSDIAHANKTGLCCTHCSHREAKKKHHETTQMYCFCKHNKTTRLEKKQTVSCVNTDTFYTINSFQASCFFSFHLIHIFFHSASVIMKFIQYEEMSERGKCNFSLTSYSPRRASHLLSDQLLKIRFSSEQLPFAPVLKLKFKGKAPTREGVLEEHKIPK